MSFSHVPLVTPAVDNETELEAGVSQPLFTAPPQVGPASDVSEQPRRRNNGQRRRS